MTLKQFHDSLDSLDMLYINARQNILDITAPIRSIGKLLNKKRRALIKEINETPDFKLAVFGSLMMCKELDLEGNAFNETALDYRSFLMKFFYPHKSLKKAMGKLDGEALSYIVSYMMEFCFDEEIEDLDEPRWEKIEENLSTAFSECLRESFYKFDENLFDIIRRKFVNEKALYRGL